MVPPKHNIALAYAHSLQAIKKISKYRAMVLVSFASAHPEKWDEHSREWDKCYAPLISDFFLSLVNC